MKRLEVLNGNAPRRSAARSNMQGLEQALRASIEGEVRFDAGSLALYTTDASHYRQIPLGVVLPKQRDDVERTITLCRQFQVPLLPRGGGTSLAGQTCNVAVVLDMSKYMNQIVELNPQQRIARVQPGIILDHLREAAEQHHLTFAPDPATHSRCTIGGMLGNNSCGVHSIMGGKTVDNTEALDILTYDGLHMQVGKTSEAELEQIIQAGGRRGEIYARLKALRDRYEPLIRSRYPKIPRRVSGYNLDDLLPENGFNVARALVGSEGTCVTILEATLRLVDSPPVRSLLVLGYLDGYMAADHVMEIMAHKPVGLEGFDQGLVNDLKRKGIYPGDESLLPAGGGWLMVEFGGASKEDADEQARGLMEELRRKKDAPSMKLVQSHEEVEKIWQVRESGLGAMAFVPGKNTTWPGWEDSAVPPEHMGGYLRDLRTLTNKYGYACNLYGHYGDGCVHSRIDFDLETAQGIKNYRSFVEEAADLVVRYGGSLSGEHGDGQSRAELLPKMFGPELVDAFREFKAIWDPNNKMNPGKVVDAYRLDENLRLGTSYNPPQLKTHFQYPDDQGSFSRATLRCVGVGKCRRMEVGTMCPSFMVTREEEHSTRGRTHMLFEMLQGDVIKEGWHSDEVKEALDLCLSCKSCKQECPVNVDMATYKAEYLSHYYEGRLRPIAAYSMGLIYWWARLASRMPRLVNFVTHAPLLSRAVKALGGIAQERSMPTFATQTFKQWFSQHKAQNTDGPQVILWPDTFNNYLRPEAAIAATEVLETLGYQVIVPRQSLCCGRPLYDFGMLDTAKQLLRQILETLRPEIRAGIPIVGLEPSCVAVFRDELRNLFPNDEDAKRLTGQAYLLSEFLNKQAPDYQFPQLKRKAILHGHCHHKAIMRMDDEKAVLKRLGVEYHELDSGCCGMAGAFGFEKDHYEVSVKAGERILLPAVRAADNETLIISDGFSCREQINQLSEREGLHLAQIIQMALHPEKEQNKKPRLPAIAKQATFIGLMGALSAAGLVIGRLIANRRQKS